MPEAYPFARFSGKIVSVSSTDSKDSLPYPEKDPQVTPGEPSIGASGEKPAGADSAPASSQEGASNEDLARDTNLLSLIHI